MSKRIINLRSDTQTLPTSEMLEAMAKAALGDDVYREDPTVRLLEELTAETLGKEAAVFVPSGTMGNLIALKAHTQPGEEIILEKESHIYYSESGGFSTVCGLSPRLIPGHHGVMNPEDVEQAIRPPNIHYPPTSLLAYENTHNRAGGTVVSVDISKALFDVAKRHGLSVHLDGARIFNAAIYLGVDAKALASFADSVMFCLSKGLSAPAGSILTGFEEFIERARHIRKMLGGGMRQVGVLGAAGILALTKMKDRLIIDHENARLLATEMVQLPGISIDLDTVQTNIVNISLDIDAIILPTFVEELKRHGILVSARPPRIIRMVTHRHITKEDIKTTVSVVNGIISKFL